MLPNTTDRAALNRELGVDVVLASRTAAVATKPFRILSPGGLAGIHLTPFVGTFRDSFPAGSGGGTITLTFSDRLTAVSGACDYRSTEYVSGGNQPGTYTFVGNKYPKLHLQDGRVTGTIVWIKHYERFPSAISQNSFAVEGKIDFQTGTITGHATDEPSYTWEVKFQPIQVEPVAWGPPPPVKR